MAVKSTAKPAPRRKRRTARTPAPQSSTLPGAALAFGGAVLAAVGAVAVGWWLRSQRGGLFGMPAEGHAAPDLAGDARPEPGDRAPPAFRPDMDAPMTAAEREALRPALGAPTLVAGQARENIRVATPT